MTRIRHPLVAVSLLTALLAGCTQAPDTGTPSPAVEEVTVDAPPPVDQTMPEPPPSAPILPPSFDCAKAEGDAQALICRDQRLAELDVELNRLFTLASGDESLDPASKEALGATQRGWIEGRDECSKSDDLRSCILGESVLRILALRVNSVKARGEDGYGISRGPSAWRCTGMGALISSVFVNGEPSSMALVWNDRTLALEGYPDPDGVRYAGKSSDGDYTWLVKGSHAMFAQPDQPALSCEIEPIS